MVNLGRVLGAVGQGFTGLAVDRQQQAAKIIQDQRAARDAEQAKIAAAVEARRAAAPGVIAQNWAKGVAGDTNAQAAMVGAEPALASRFEAPDRPVTPTLPRKQVVDGQVVDLDASSATPIQGYVPPKKEPSPAQAGVEEQRKFQRSQALGADYKGNPTVKGAYGVADAVSGLKAALSGDSPMDDLSVIYQTVKLFDPGTAVREGEISLFRQANSLPGRVSLLVDNWNKGKLLTPAMREDIKQLLEARVQQSERQVAPIQSEFGSMARRYGVEQDSAFIAPSPFRGQTGALADPAKWLESRRSGRKP